MVTETTQERRADGAPGIPILLGGIVAIVLSGVLLSRGTDTSLPSGTSAEPQSLGVPAPAPLMSRTPRRRR